MDTRAGGASERGEIPVDANVGGAINRARTEVELAVGAHFIAPATIGSAAAAVVPVTIEAPAAVAPTTIEVAAVVAAPAIDELPDADRLLPLSAPERGLGGEISPILAREVTPDPAVELAPVLAHEVSRAPLSGSSPDVATRLLAEILALDLGNVTPIKALTLLHELQTRAREAVPWSSWMAELAGAREVRGVPPPAKTAKTPKPPEGR
jgi:hypothetical protein